MKNRRIISIAIMMCIIAPMIYITNPKASCNHIWILDKDLSYEATCTSEGKRWYECSICYDYKIEEIPPTGIHKWTEWKADGYLCQSGKYTRYCIDCDLEETKVRQGNGEHLWSEWERWTDPNCLNDGKDRRKCLNCYTDEYRVVPKDENAHDWSSWSSDGNATVIKKGTISRYCYTCNKKQKKYGKKLKPFLKGFAKKKKLKKGNIYIPVLMYETGDDIKSYTSSNKKIATFKKGIVTAKRKGKCTLIIKMKSGLKKKCKLTVK